MKKTRNVLIVIVVIAIFLAVCGIVLSLSPLQYVPAQEATCENAGNTEYYRRWPVYFKDRDAKERIDKSETIIPALGHDVEEISAVAATCTEDGNIQYYRCTRCHKIFFDENCQNEISDVHATVDQAMGHAEFIRYEADGNAQGEHIAYCTNKNCPGKKMLCDFPAWDRVENCTVDETLRRSCSLCGQEETQEHKAVAAHSWESWEEAEPATCLNDGLQIRACKNCKQTEEKQIDRLPHVLEVSENYWEEDGFVPSTQNSYAQIPYHCANCEQEFGAETWSDTFAYADRKNIRIEDKNYAGTVIMFDPVIGSLGFNLSAMDNDLSGLEYEGYDRQSHAFTILSTYSGQQVKEAKIIGRPTAFEQLAFTTEMFGNFTIILQNLLFTAVDGQSCMDLSKINNCQLVIYGTVSLEGNNGGMGINAQNLTISGSGTFIVKGGDGKAGARAAEKAPEGDGANGGIGLLATNLMIEMKGWLSVLGGNGGDAYDYTNQKGDGNYGDDHDGWAGHIGGEGGCAINATKIVLNFGSVTAQGGSGGDGGDAGECNMAMSDVKGGKGGRGGAGGEGITAKNLEVSTGGDISAEGGRGGDSGKPGGVWQNDRHGEWLGTEWNATDGELGNAGSGGKGLSNGCSITGDRSSISQKKGQDGTVITELNQND